MRTIVWILNYMILEIMLLKGVGYFIIIEKWLVRYGNIYVNILYLKKIIYHSFIFIDFYKKDWCNRHMQKK